VRVTARDARSKDLLPRVQVKVIGTINPEFFSGETDLRGVFVAEGVIGQVTAVIRKDTTGYAFYRGTSFVGQAPVPAPPGQSGQAAGQTQAPQMPALNQALDANLKMINSSNNLKQIQRLEERYKVAPAEQPRGAPAGEFRAPQP
jgi:hypothetical protein